MSKQTAIQVLNVFKRFLTKSSYLNNEARHLLSKVNYYNKILHRDFVCIRLISDASVSKLLAINFILSVANLTIKGNNSNDSNSCTYVIIKFM